MNRVLAAILIGFSLAATAAADPTPRLPLTAAQRQALGIEIGAAQARSLVPQPTLPGRISLPNDRVRVVTVGSSGRLLSPLVAVGDRVSEGQALARIESPSVVALQRAYLEALSQLELARSTARREQQLAEEGVIAGRRAARSASLLRESQARLDEGRQTLELSGMSADELSTLDRTRRLQPIVVVRAPLEGVVLEQHAKAGERLESEDALYRIGDVLDLTVDIHTPIDLAQGLREGTRFVLPDQDGSGRVLAVGSEIHSLDQGVLVRGAIEQSATRLRPGQFVRVRFETPREHGAAFAVPAAAVVHVAQQAWVYREVGAGFEPVPVTIVGGSGQETLVVGPLVDGAALAVRGTAALKSLWLATGGPG